MGWWALLPLALLAGCGVPQTGGTSGTESDNALTVQVLGQSITATPLEWRVYLWPEGQIPDTSGTPPVFQDSAGADQKAHLRIPAGAWSVLVLYRGSGYRAVSEGTDTIADTLRPLQSVSGTVVGGVGDWVLLPGLGRGVKCSETGDFRIDSLPQGLVPLAVRHQGRIGTGKIWVSGTAKAELRIVPDSLDGGWIGPSGP